MTDLLTLPQFLFLAAIAVAILVLVVTEHGKEN